MRFRWWYPILNQPNSRWGWLAPMVSHGQRPLSPLPWGWRWLRCMDRHAAYRVPVWIYGLAYAWTYRWWVLAPFVRWGWLVEPHDGCWWHEVRPRGWNAEREAGWRWVKTGEWT